MDLREAKILMNTSWLILNQNEIESYNINQLLEIIVDIENAIYTLKIEGLISPLRGEFFSIRRSLKELCIVFERLSLSNETGVRWMSLHQSMVRCKSSYSLRNFLRCL